MCGIFGFIKKKNIKIDKNLICKITNELDHRGPDSSDNFEDENILLIHTRLKIIDPSNDANQPMFSDDKRFILVYNGEIYNFLKIKSTLELKGYRFKTNSDTEVVLNSFIEWGDDFVDQLAGMFSIIIYDNQTKKTNVYRDRLGIKPLYTYESEDGLYFSSEIKPLLNFKNAAISEGALWSYFNLRFTQGNETLFEDIKEFSPGSYKTFLRSEQIFEKKYWDLRNIKASEEILSNEDFLSLFETVVSEHNIADTSVGAFLSGGVDSASIVAQSTYSGYPINSYTFSTGTINDESERAKLIANKLGIPNVKIDLNATNLKEYKKAIRSLEDPIGDSIILPTMLLACGVSKHHKVVLSGEGADEIFSGYIHHQVLTLENSFYQKTPRILWKSLSNMFQYVPQSLLEVCFPYPSKLGASGKEKLKHHLDLMSNEFERYISLAGLFEDPISSKIFNKRVSRPKELKEYWDSLHEFEFSDKLKRFDLNYWARNYTLHRIEKLSMNNSLEARVPFFDHRLVEFVLKMKSKNLYNFRDPKQYFRKSLEKSNLSLSQNVIRRKKQAFYLPTEKVFSSSSIQLAKENILDNANRRDIFNFDNLEHLFKKENLELLDAKQFQCLFNFELWCQEFID
jgi:asparagine synthase (glutamine-hydrolysing)